MDDQPGDADDRVKLPWDLAAAIARAGVDPTLPRKALEKALRRAIADRRGYIDFDYDEIGWVVFLLSPDRTEFRGDTLRHALSWCLVWLMEEEFSGGILSDPTA